MIYHDCPCGGPKYAGTAAQFLHNTTLTHQLAVLDETGAPKMVIEAKKKDANTCFICQEDVTSSYHCGKGIGHKV